MPEKGILIWLKQAREAGLSDMEIQGKLKAAGWNNTLINQLLKKEQAVKLKNEKPVNWPEAPPRGTMSLEIEQKPELAPATSRKSLLGIFYLLIQSWEIYKKRIGTFVFIELLSIIVFGAIYALTILALGGALGLSSFFTVTSGSALSIIFIIIITGAVVVICSLIAAWFQAAILQAIRYPEKTVTLMSILRSSFRLTIPLWWLNILISLIIGGAALITTISVAIFPLFNDFDWSPFVISAIALLGLMPSLVISVWLSLSHFVLTTEKIRGLAAVLRSREYIREIWWSVFWRQAIVALFFSVLILTFINLIASSLISLIVIIIISLLFFPFLICYYYSIYNAIVVFKEGRYLNTPAKTKKGIIGLSIIGLFTIPVIITIMSSYGLVNSKINERDEIRHSDLYQLNSVLTIYLYKNDQYPANLELLVPEYLTELPLDPKNNKPYQYTPTVTIRGKTLQYLLCADLELPDESGTTSFCINSAEAGSAEQ